MSTVTRKQREIQEREAQILEVARRDLVERGYHGLRMDRIAGSVQYSKGTIYNHFSCKEEIIIALVIQTMEKRAEMFQKAAAFSGLSRERMAAIGVASDRFVQLFPDHFNVEQVIRSASIWEKTSEKRRAVMRACEHRCVGIVAGVVTAGVASGDLTLPPGVTPEQMVFGLWSQSLGAYSIIATSDALSELGIQHPFETLRRNLDSLLDGWGWKPLFQDHDYEATRKRVLTEVFGDAAA